MTFNIFSFSKNENYILDENNASKATNVILFLLIHEYLGHQKKHINNENSLTQRKNYKNEFRDFSYDKIDNGSALELIIIGKIVNIKHLMKSQYSKELLDPNIYIGKDFNKLRDIYSLIEKDYNIIKDKNENINQKKPNNSSDIKKVPFENGYNINTREHLMYPELLQLFSGISDEKKEQLKDDEDYQRFLQLYEERHQKTSKYFKKEDLLAFRFGKKK